MKTDAELRHIIESANKELFDLRKILIKETFSKMRLTWLDKTLYLSDRGFSYLYLTDISSILNVDSIFTYLQIEFYGDKVEITSHHDSFACYDGEQFGDGFLQFCKYKPITDESLLGALNNLLAGYIPFKQGHFS